MVAGIEVFKKNKHGCTASKNPAHLRGMESYLYNSLASYKAGLVIYRDPHAAQSLTSAITMFGGDTKYAVVKPDIPTRFLRTSLQTLEKVY